MYLCGLPVRRVWTWVEKFLQKYTDELPGSSETAASTPKKKKEE
jgi:hypothetical protein